MIINEINKNILLEVGINAAKIAGKILKDGLGTQFSIKSKEGKHNLVTEFDFRSEKAIIDYIKANVPNSQFLAEESGKSGSNDNDTILWIVDPLDGTVNFAHNIPVFSVSIAATYKNEIFAGVVYQPILDELFTATKSGGAFLNHKAIKVSHTENFEDAFFVTGFPYRKDAAKYNGAELFIDVVQKGIPIRRLGSAAMDLAYVAAGRFDGFWEEELNPWDVAAGVLLVNEAGGKVTQYDLSDYNVFNKTILSTNGILHNQVSQFLNKNNL